MKIPVPAPAVENVGPAFATYVFRNKAKLIADHDEYFRIQSYSDALVGMIARGLTGFFIRGNEDLSEICHTDTKRLMEEYDFVNYALRSYESACRRSKKAPPCAPCHFDVRAFANEMRA